MPPHRHGHSSTLLCLALLLGGCGRREPANAPAEAATAAGGADAADAAVRADRSGLTVAVDARVELFSILCRLAGYREYSRAPRSPYLDAMEAYFAAFRDHPAVQRTAELKASHSISHDAPITLALYLDPGTLQPIRPLAPRPPGLDPRWEGVAIDAYLEEVRAFAQASGFEAFWAAQQPYVSRVEERYRGFLGALPIIAWFDGVFGKRAGARYRFAPGLIVSPMSFAARIVHEDGSEDVAQVVFLENPDPEGLPRPTETTLEVTVHEIAHSYVNPALDPRMSELEAAARPAFARVEAAMARQSYPAYSFMVNESVVRAVTLLFLRERSTTAHATRTLAAERKRSFLWIGELADALAARRAERAGRLGPDDLVQVTRDVLARWLAATE